MGSGTRIPTYGISPTCIWWKGLSNSRHGELRPPLLTSRNVTPLSTQTMEEMTMTAVHAICTGLVQVKLAQIEGRGKGLARAAHILFDEGWSDWLPIYAWVIDHPEGIIVVDTGETARVHERGYHPRWHPFFRRAARFSVHPEEEIGPQLRALGIAARDVRQVVITHLHTDHAGGLVHLSGSKTWVAPGELRRAGGFG